MTNERLDRHAMATYTTVSKAMMTLLLLLWWWTMPETGCTPAGGTVWEHILWPLSHANVWHLAGNLYFLWLLKGRLYMRECYVMAVLCSFLPVVPGVWDWSAEESLRTVGFSGVLCAMVGVKWGAWMKNCHETAAYWTFAKRVLPYMAVGFLIPHVNWSIHLYCLLAGLAYGRWQ